MAGEYTLSVLLKAQDAASSVVQGFLSHLGPVGAVVGAVGGALLSVGVQSVQMAAGFQESMTQLVTGAGESQKNIALVSNGILDMAVQTGTSTQQLAAGMYLVESSGYHGAAGLSVLQSAAEGARVGAADLSTVVSTLTTVLTDYHMPASAANQATSALIATVAAGKTHLQDLATSMGSVLPLASALGISFPQVGGAIAVMTNAGMTAQRASMNLANAIRSLAAPAKTAMTAMKSVGLSAQQLKDTMSTQGLTGAMQLIEKHIGETFPAGSVAGVQAFKAIMGGATGYNVALMLGGKNMKSFENNVSSISSAMKNGKNSVQGWALVQQDFNFKVAQAKEVVETLMIRIGQALLPVVTRLMDAVLPIISSFSNWISKSGILQGVVNSLTSAIMPAVNGFTRWFTSGNNLKNGLSLVGGVVKQVGAVVMGDLIKPVAHLVSVVAPLVSGFANWAIKSGALKLVLNLVGGSLKFIGGVVGSLIGGLASIVGFFEKCKTAAALLIIPLGAIAGWLVFLAVDAALQFLATLPGIIAGFITEAGVATLSAIATLAAAAPFILIGLAIGAVIAIVVLLIMHWRQVTAFLVSAWKAASGWIVGAFHSIANFFSSIWAKIVGFFKSHILLIVAIITGPLGALIILIVTHWRQIVAFFSGLWSDVVGVFHSAVSWLEHAVTSIWSAIVSIVTTWPGKALQWGKDLIQNLINGILSMIGGIGSAVGQIAGKIAGFLHFSKPDFGPLASVMSWMPDFGTLLAAGLVAQKGKLQAAVTTMVQPIAGGVSGASGAPALGSGAPATSTGGAAGGNTYVMNLTVNAQTKVTRQFVQEIEQELSAWLRSTGMQPATASGRRW